MKNSILIIVFLFICSYSFSQISIIRSDGGPMVVSIYKKQPTHLNPGSTILREWIILNDNNCPLQLGSDIGINTIYKYENRAIFSFSPTGSLTVLEPITAYEIHHILYNVFGEYILSIKNVDIIDISEPSIIKEGISWFATDHQIREYSSCVSYIAVVRTKSGKIWRFDPLDIKEELNAIQITYEEGYSPSKDEEKK